ncbi:hypothetical protein NEOLEDRAFT_1137865, partial [Neolentinus lepideus HHB14362 ss-1]
RHRPLVLFSLLLLASSLSFYRSGYLGGINVNCERPTALDELSIGSSRSDEYLLTTNGKIAVTHRSGSTRRGIRY